MKKILLVLLYIILAISTSLNFLQAQEDPKEWKHFEVYVKNCDNGDTALWKGVLREETMRLISSEFWDYNGKCCYSLEVNINRADKDRYMRIGYVDMNTKERKDIGFTYHWFELSEKIRTALINYSGKEKVKLE